MKTQCFARKRWRIRMPDPSQWILERRYRNSKTGKWDWDIFGYYTNIDSLAKAITKAITYETNKYFCDAILDAVQQTRSMIESQPREVRK